MHLGKKVIQDSAQALWALHQDFPGSFQSVVEALWQLQGKLICTGMGKSGYVAKKVAATLSSTGTSAFFVHPAESAHGDLGMIQPHDAVLSFSLSGETAEVIQLLQHSPTKTSFSITAKPQSTIGRLSQWVLNIPPYPEACPLGLAPTTSCIMMMALGDALAMALLSKKNFSPQDFRSFHPSGSLGRALHTVEDLMITPPPVFPESIAVGDLLAQWIGMHSPVVGLVSAEGILTATLRARDIYKWQNREKAKGSVGLDQPFPKPFPPLITLSTTMTWSDGQKTMQQHGQSSMLVVDDQHRPVGLVHSDSGILP